MAEKNRQHYVPKFYLRNFSESKKSIASFNLSRGLFVGEASIKNMCQRNNFYGADNQTENFLGEKIETPSALIIQNILKTNTLPDELEDYAELLWFILTSEARHLKTAESLNHTFESVLKAKMELNPQFKEVDLDKYQITINEPANVAIQQAIENLELVLDLEPLLIIERTGGTRQFITSDYPVVRYNSFYLKKQYYGGFGNISRGAQFFIPLSPHVCILLYDKDIYHIPQQEKNILSLRKAKEVDQLNQLFFLNAHNNVFCAQKTKEDYIKELHRKCRNDPKIADLDREITKFSSLKSSEGHIIQFRSNRVRKNIDFSWLKFTKFSESLKLPAHIGGLHRSSAAIHEYLRQREEEYKMS
ncbi:DUF4238 domain-containing protein [Paenibacillus sp. LS1]|nr:DUF4238 domain-containing protein [Paenibacillus sp. LS1]